MDWPGEKLLIKLWETLAEKGVGSLLKPWQIQREGKAAVDLRKYEIIALAEAEREADEIRSGRQSLPRVTAVLSLPENESAAKSRDSDRSAPLLEIAMRSMVADAMQKEVNVAKSVLHAEDELRNDAAPIPENNIDEDWLHRWREYAGSVSSEDLQMLWGRILAGELKSPGKNSYRLLDFIRNLTKDEASLIERMAPFVIKDLIPRDMAEFLTKAGVSFKALLHLQYLGILSGVESVGLSMSFESLSSDQYTNLLGCHGRGLLVEQQDPKLKLNLSSYFLTSLGKQVIELGTFVPNDEYLMEFGRKLRRKNFDVSLVSYEKVSEDTVKLGESVRISD